MHIIKGKNENRELNRAKGLWFKAKKELSSGKWLKAVNYLNKCIEIKEDYIPALSTLSDIYLQNGSIEEAEKYIRLALKHAPDNPESHFIMGNIALKKDIGMALYYFEKAEELGGLTWGVAHNLALCYMHNNDNIKAGEYLIKARELEPNNIQTLKLIAHFYTEQYRFEEAKSILLEAKRKNPRDVQIDYLLGLVFFRLGKLKDCINYWEKFYNENKDNIHFVEQMIKVYYRAGQINKCIQIVKDTLEIEPNNQGLKATLEMLKKENK